ncbi:MAG TPA: glycosyltransferase [Anaerolineales bacterium]|nr:glycosyltransferase [Anaerolineales bacterium]
MPAAAISVLMPCYNAGATVDEALASILNQTRTDFELIAVDDGSTDDTRRHLETWAQRDRRVAVLARPHGGLVNALQAGLAACRAPLVARMDADDRSISDRLEKQVDLLESQPEAAVVGCLVEPFPPQDVRQGFRLYVEWLNSLVTPQAIAREIFVESPLAHASVVMRRDWLERVGGYQDRGWPEDYDLWLRLHLAGARFAKVPEVLVGWRENPARATRTDRRYSVENFLRAKAHYLTLGPLVGRESLLIWGAGQMGRRLSKHLLRGGAPLRAFIDIDPAKIGRMRRGVPIVAVEELPSLWSSLARPVLLAAVGSRGARGLIRTQLAGMGLVETQDWWAVA